MKTFKDLEFNEHPNGMGGVQAKIQFPNGFGASVVKTPFSYGGKNGQYELAVFGQGANEVDLLVKGDLTVAPELEDQYVSWYDVKSYQSVDEMPPNEKPVGLLRFNKGRSITYNGEKYMDIRPAIATASRAGNAIDVSYLT
jgi:hypothetical protein